MSVKIQESKMEFKVDGVPHKVHVFHNIEDYGQDINSAFDNWTARTKVFTSLSFAKYLRSKSHMLTGLIALTKQEYDKAIKK